jgi:hypothetical protein
VLPFTRQNVLSNRHGMELRWACGTVGPSGGTPGGRDQAGSELGREMCRTGYIAMLQIKMHCTFVL